MNNSPLITIVVPVYNIEKYLDRCISSIINQSFQDFELILVDDGSKDKSAQICDNYVLQDSRVKVIHKPNGGVSTARNRGIDEANGSYICFVDSDDWLEQTYLQNFVDAVPEKYGVVLQSFFYDYEDSDKTVPHVLPEKQIDKASELEFFLEYTDGVHNGFLWHRLFHTNIIKENRIRYPENVSFAEDGIFFLNYISYIDKYYITSKTGYHYFIRSNSLTSKGKTLPIDTYCFLLNSFAEPTQRIIEQDRPDDRIEQGLRRYMWRLAYEWICDRSIHGYTTYKEVMPFWKAFAAKYRIDTTVKDNSLLFKSIQRAMGRNASFVNYIWLLFVLQANSAKQRIDYKLKAIFRR